MSKKKKRKLPGLSTHQQDCVDKAMLGELNPLWNCVEATRLLLIALVDRQDKSQSAYLAGMIEHHTIIYDMLTTYYTHFGCEVLSRGQHGQISSK